MQQFIKSSQIKQIKELIENNQHILIIQADNPDADSLGSALALEQIFTKLNKTVDLFCAVHIPNYLHYLTGWDRVSNEMPKKIDVVFFVDVSTLTLLDKIIRSKDIEKIKNKQVIILDHHQETKNIIDFANLIISTPNLSSTGELIYQLSNKLNWPITTLAKTYIMASVLGDTQGLSNNLTKISTYRLLANLIETGVDRLKLEEKRREYSLMPLKIFRYKAELINRTEFFYNDSIGILILNQEDINNYSYLYNPGPLIRNDILQTEGVRVSIIIKQYDDHHITAAIRSNYNYPIAADLASFFGGGGHIYTSGLNKKNVINIDKFKTDIIEKANELLNKL